MGYESSGYGNFSLRDNAIDIENIENLLRKSGFDVSCEDDSRMIISFNGFRMSSASEELKIIQNYLNGEFIIAEEEYGDIRKLIFDSGSVSVRKGEIVFSDESINIDLDDEQWFDF